MKNVWIFLIGLGFVFSFINGKPETAANVLFFDLQQSVELIVKLIPVMAFWTGLMSIVEKSGILNKLAVLIKPAIKFLFKEVENNTKAVNAIIMTIAANILGIGNSATAFGLKAMHEMQLVNKDKSTANNAMCMFLIINVSSIQLIPLNVIKLRADAGAGTPGDILLPTMIATSFSTAVAIIFAKYFERKGVR
ncbi:nucleoside recognition domain-containing protein [Sedimentibacter sp.]|uniref:nucleoside recognition domain-containing protein n=1 Tax=Sedimentibacter sp. TaxID=1960295 RepID=UPI0028972EFA|nr:nucleoside recognition domain-containing protein [Sedimentibacter sp.]